MTEADLLARDLFEARCQLQEAGRTLHDQAGTLLAAAGIQLQLLLLDFPQAAAPVRETLGVLEQANESIRGLSQRLDPSPASHVGLDRALRQLAEELAPSLAISYSARISPPISVRVAIYEAILAALARTNGAPARVEVRGTANRLAVRLVWKGGRRWPKSEIAALARRLRPGGIVLDVTTKESTIVSIRYAARRLAGR